MQAPIFRFPLFPPGGRRDIREVIFSVVFFSGFFYDKGTGMSDQTDRNKRQIPD